MLKNQMIIEPPYSTDFLLNTSTLFILWNRLKVQSVKEQVTSGSFLEMQIN